MLNALIILIIILVLVLVGFILWPRISSKIIKQKVEITAYDDLLKYVKQQLSNAVSSSAYGIGLTSEEIRKNMKTREDIKTYLHTACSGDQGARNSALQLVKNRVIRLVNERSIDDLISFSPESATANVKFESMLYCYSLMNEDKYMSGGEFAKFINDLEHMRGSRVTTETITEEDLTKVYTGIYKDFNYDDKINILTQLVFSDLYGLGTIDSLNYQTVGIEEIQIGLGGVYKSIYDYKLVLKNIADKTRLAKDSVYVIYKGHVLWLKFLSFKDNAALKRTIRNLILNAGAGDLTEQTPYIQTETADGRRIAVSRPPFTDAWIGFIRKFNSTSTINLNDLYDDKLIVSTIDHLVDSGMNIAVTGEMESGKTTLLRANLARLNPKYSVRIIENGSFELNGRKYLPEMDVTSLKITDNITEEECLAFSRKTSGSIFVIGEVTSLAMANLCNKVAKIATQLFYSAHYPNTDKMIADFKNALLQNGFSVEKIAEAEVVNGMGFDIHVRNKNGLRFIEYINEVIPKKDGYDIMPIVTYDEESCKYIPQNFPSARTYAKAKLMLSSGEFEKFKAFFDTEYAFCNKKIVQEAEKEILPSWANNLDSNTNFNY